MDLRFLVVFCLLAATNADRSIVSSGKCLIDQCTETDLLRYEPGRTYVYKYSLNTRIQSWDADVTIDGNALITKKSPCEFSIKLADVKVTGIPDGPALADALEAKLAHFVNTDGLISEICHQVDEDPWVLNIKKAIVSTLQISTKSIDRGVRTSWERDLLGDCEAKYEHIDESGAEITLTKTKDLMKCQNHFTNSLAHTYEALVGTGRNTQTCVYKITTQKSIIRSVNCKQGTDARYRHVSEIQLQYVSDGPASGGYQQDLANFRRSSLLFAPQPPKYVDEQELKYMLEALCSSTGDLIKPTAPHQFRKFVHALDGTRYEHLKSLWQSVEQKSLNCDAQRVKKLFIQAITYSRSGAALRLAHDDLFKRGIMSADRVKAMVHSLIFKNYINKETMEALVQILQSDLVMHQSLFGITAAIQSYVDAGHDKEIALVALKLIADKINVNEPKFATIVVRALGNVRIWDDALNEKILRVIDSNEAELVVAALDTLGKKHPENHETHDRFKKLIFNKQTPIEVRVAAFKAYTQCVKSEDLTEIFTKLNSMNDGNFYGYVQSFLATKYKTMDPDYQALRIEIDRASSINLKPEQFYHSRHWAFSKQTPKGLTGINMEADLVVENNKNVPTWFIFNASIPIHRHNVHGFEIGFRQEGLDDVAVKIMEKIKGTNWQYAMDEIKERQNFQPFADELSKIQREFVTKFQRNGKLSVYVALNEQTLFYFNGLKSEASPTIRNPVLDLLDSVRGLNTIAAISFANYEASNPLMTGLEIHYWHVGTMVAGLKLDNESGQKRNFYPNIAGDYVMARDLVLREPFSGQVRNLTLSSNAFLQYTVAFEKNKYFKLDLDLPAEEMDLFRVQDQHYHYKPTGQMIKEFIHNNERDECTQTQSWGIQFCSEHQTARDQIVSWRFYLKKSDRSMSGVSASIKRESGDEYVLNFNTPGSSIPRSVEMRFKSIFNRQESELRASLKSANLELSGEARLERSADKVAMPITITVNKKIHTLRWEISSDSQMKAKLQIASPKLSEPIDYDAQFSRFNGKVEEKFIKIFSNSKNRKRTQVLMVRLVPENWRSINDFKGLFQIEANCPKAGNVLTMTTLVSRSQEYPAKIDSKVSYQRDGKQQQGSFNTAIRSLSTRDLMNYQVSGQVECSEWQQKGAKFANEFMFNPERISNKLELAYGRDYKTGDDLYVYVIGQNTGSGRKLDLKATAEAKFKPRDFHHKGEIMYRRSKSSDVELDQLKMTHENVKNDRRNHEATLERSIRGSDVEVNGKWKCQSGEKSFILKLDRSQPRSYKTSAQYKDTKINPSPIYEAKAQLSLDPIATEVEILKIGQPVVKARGSFDKKRPTDIKMAAELEIKEKRVLKASAMRKDNKLEALVDDEVRGNSLNFNAELDRQAVFDYKHNKQPVYQMVIKKSPSSTGNLYEIKSLTKRGIKRIPDVVAEIEPKKFGYDLEIKGESYTIASKALVGKSTPRANFMVTYDCAKHRNVHKTEFNMDKSKISLISRHAKGGETIYELKTVHERNNEGRSNLLELKAKNALEINAVHVYSPREMKLNFTMAGKRDLELYITSVKDTPVRGARHIEEPRVTKVRAVYKSKVGEGAVFKTYGEYKSSPKALRLTSVEYMRGNQREFLGSTNIAIDSPLYARIVTKSANFDMEVDPWSPKKEVKYEYKTSNSQGSLKVNAQSVEEKQVRLQGSLNLESKKRRDAKVAMDASADVNLRNGLKGEVIVNWTPVKSSTPEKFQAKIDLSDKIVKGPHSIVITKEKAELNFNHEVASARNKVNSKTTLIVKDKSGQKLVDATVDGDYSVSSGKALQIKTTIDSAKYPSLQSVNHILSVTAKPNEWQIMSKLNQYGKTTRVTLKRDATSAVVKNLFTVDGFMQDGSPAKFEMKSECSDKCDFDAQLLKNNKEHSKLEVRVPLVGLTEFITKRASARFNSPVFGTEALFEIDAPATNNILVRAHANVDQKPIIAYRLQISDGASFKPYGADFKASGDSILFEQELKWKRNQLAEQKILVAQNAIAANLIVGPFKTVNTLVPGDRARTLGQTCWTSQDMCAEYKLTLEKQTSTGAKYDVVLKLQERSAEQYKLHSQFEYDLRPKNERFDILSTFKDRSYGFGVERVISSSKNLLKIKGVLPKRSPELHIEYQPFYGNELVGKVILYHDIRKDSEKMVTDFKFNWENTSNKFTFNQLITMTHTSIAEPFIVEAKYSMDKARRKELSIFGFKSFDYNGKIAHGGNGYLYGEANWAINSDRMDYKFNVYNQDKKLNFGCVANSERTIASRSLQGKRDWKCHWTNRDGEIKTIQRDYAFDGQFLREGLKFNFQDAIMYPLMNYKINGKINTADKLNFAHFDVTFPEGPSYNIKVFIKEKCIYLTSKALEANPKLYLLESCWNKRPRGDEAYFTFNFTEQSTGESLVSFKVSRMADFAHDKKVSLKWNTELVSDAVIAGIHSYEEDFKQSKEAFAEAQREMSHKVHLVKSAFGEKLAQPFVSYWTREIERFAREMEPEFEYIKGILPVQQPRRFRFTRSIPTQYQYNTWTDYSPVNLEWVVKDLDGGELEMIVRNVNPEYLPKDIAAILYKLWHEMHHY